MTSYVRTTMIGKAGMTQKNIHRINKCYSVAHHPHANDQAYMCSVAKDHYDTTSEPMPNIKLTTTSSQPVHPSNIEHSYYV